MQQALKGPVSPYTGSEATYDMVKQQIAERWGAAEAEQYDPYMNCLTFRQWLARGYRVRKGEKSLRSITFVEKKDEDGNVEKKYKKTVCLFYYKQVEKIEDHEK